MMTLCPVAIAIGCKKCPIFAVCPVKTIIGDYRPDQHPPETSQSKKKAGATNKPR